MTDNIFLSLFFIWWTEQTEERDGKFAAATRLQRSMSLFFVPNDNRLTETQTT